MKVPYFLNPWFARFLITWLPEPAEMVNLKETAEMSDSDNESANDNFEYCSTNQSDHLLLHKPTFWLGTQNGLWVTNIEHLLCCLGETLAIIRWTSNSNFHRNIMHTITNIQNLRFFQTCLTLNLFSAWQYTLPWNSLKHFLVGSGWRILSSKLGTE